jgi:hypothetical protein
MKEEILILLPIKKKNVILKRIIKINFISDYWDLLMVMVVFRLYIKVVIEI